MMATSTIVNSVKVYCFLVLVMIFAWLVGAAPLLPPYECKGSEQPDGTVTFNLPGDFPDLVAKCEPEILIKDTSLEDIISVIYENGNVTWIPPVLGATKRNFTLNRCPRSVKIAWPGLACPLWFNKATSCSCESLMNSTQNQILTTTEAPASDHSLNDSPHRRVGVAISGVIIALCGCLALWTALCCKKREKDMDHPLGDSSAETSPSSSSEQLPGSQDPTEAAPIMGHGGT
ncbi:uncharacterized protein LOC134448599 [Engraulis encrasicolus]|uniref:uncharacterized protein LOC134448599 n=1 Tax=Engraulis encrasicolus TaxID=184585 RepID=UPI002FD5DD98